MIDSLKHCRNIHSTIIVVCAALWAFVFSIPSLDIYEHGKEYIDFLEILEWTPFENKLRDFFYNYDEPLPTPKEYIKDEMRDFERGIVNYITTILNDRHDVDTSNATITSHWGVPTTYFFKPDVQSLDSMARFSVKGPNCFFMLPYDYEIDIDEYMSNRGTYKNYILRTIDFSINPYLDGGFVDANTIQDIYAEDSAAVTLELFNPDQVGTDKEIEELEIPLVLKDYTIYIRSEYWNTILNEVCIEKEWPNDVLSRHDFGEVHQLLMNCLDNINETANRNISNTAIKVELESLVSLELQTKQIDILGVSINGGIISIGNYNCIINDTDISVRYCNSHLNIRSLLPL